MGTDNAKSTTNKIKNKDKDKIRTIKCKDNELKITLV